ncbi:DUF58 domain-containing protein [Cellulosimicrobium arenosum]|uniref:DUF58 domain-containing protein n=1 Tax=Cellulosimicrobium arenosum TaxID=2708133 RepID=UPI0030CA39DD
MIETLRRRRRPLARARLTRRGLGLLAAGTVLVVVGVVLGLPDVVGLGGAGVGAVALAWAWMTVRRVDRGRSALRATRRVSPSPTVRDQLTTARLTVRAARPSASAVGALSRLRISEQAAHELCDQGALRARVTSHDDHVSVQYRLRPSRRGRWPLGPLLTTQVDALGLVSATQELGGTNLVAVWPRTVELSVRGSRAFGEQERSVAGARLASSDDSVLREYVAGDDPRRVHWASAARQGHLMVRTDESAGLPPVTVLLDRGLLPAADAAGPAGPGSAGGPGGRQQADGEWAVEAAASIGVALLQAGHPVRLVPTSAVPVVEDSSFGVHRAGEGVADLLDATVDLQGHPGVAAADRAARATAEALRTAHRPGERTVAVLGPLGPLARHAVSEMATDAVHRALVVSPRSRTASHEDALATASALRATGWHVAVVEPGHPIEHAWSRLVEENR